MIVSQAARRKSALDRLQAGDAPGAVALLGEMLAEDAGNADLLGLLGVALEEDGDKDAGAEALRRAIALPAEPSIELRNASNLAALLFDSGKREDAAELLRQGWRWRSDGPPDDRELSCIALLARMMSALKLNDALVALLLPIAQSSQLDWPCLQDLARALAALDRPREAVQLVEESPARDEDDGERDALRAYLLWKAGDLAAAAKARDTYIAKTPAFLAKAQPKQRFTIGVINEAPSGEQLNGPIPAHHFHLNFPAQLARRFADRYRFASVFAGAGPAAITQFCAFEPRVVISNLGNPEILRSDQKLPVAQHLAEAPGVPLINAPEFVAQCTRQLNAIRLKHLPNAVVPKISRFKRDPKRLDELAREIERASAYPMIVRTVADQHAINMFRTETPAELRAALTQLNGPELYVADYVGAPRREGLHRRLRAAFIDGTPIVIWADYAAQWIV